MRVNHTGEVCAQALYSGQSLVARDPVVRSALQTAAAEERDHLSWCRDRLAERDLGARPSLLDPVWYAGSFAWGVASGLAGDRWSLGFLVETEAQVERHLEGHLERLPRADRVQPRRSWRGCAMTKRDMASPGATWAGTELPRVVKLGMRAASKVMTRTAYWV